VRVSLVCMSGVQDRSDVCNYHLLVNIHLTDITACTLEGWTRGTSIDGDITFNLAIVLSSSQNVEQGRFTGSTGSHQRKHRLQLGR
jgi:hypothetical protein